MLTQSPIQASRASPAQKLQGLRVDYSKNFSRATFFVFESLSNGGKIYDQFAREKNLKKKEQCGFVGDVFIFEVKMFLTHGVEHDNSYRVIIGQFIVNETNF